MTKITKILPLLTLLFTSSLFALEIGQPLTATDIKMKNIDGKMLTIGDVATDKGTLVIFTCNACPWVKAWEGRIATVTKEFKSKGFGVIAINSNDPEKNKEDNFKTMKKRAKEKGFEFPYVVDAKSDVAKAYGAKRTPEFFLFDKTKKLVYHGALDDNAHEPDKVKETYLKNALAALSEGKAVPVATTKSIGCGIKFRN